MTEKINLCFLYNSASGSGLAQTQAAQSLADLPSNLPITQEIILAPVTDELPATKQPKLILLFSGDGTYFRLLNDSLNHPDHFILPVGWGSENATARFIGTHQRPVNQVLAQFFSHPQLSDAFTPITPWQAKDTQTNQITNFFWLFGVGNSLIGRLLTEIESLRQFFPSPDYRLAQAFLGLLSQEPQLPFQETIFTTGYLPALARFPLPSQQPQLIEFPSKFRGLPVSILSASVLAFIDITQKLVNPNYLRHHILLPYQPLKLTNPASYHVVDSEIYANVPNTDFLIQPSPAGSPFAWFPKPIQG